jgi:dTDP-4-dehydrorhamnose 3,5-epimerase
VQVTETSLPGVLIVEPRVFRDDRGFFLESYNARKMEAVGIPTHFVQDNHARSSRGVLRGLHYQIQHPQGKIVSVISGRIFDVAVDLRRSSSTFGRWTGTVLDGDALKMFWVPPGFAHGYLVLSDTVDVVYKTTDFFHPEYERTLLWNDPQVGIEWPREVSEFSLSEKDKQGALLRDAEVFA